jgi:hypothetical protein
MSAIRQQDYDYNSLLKAYSLNIEQAKEHIILQHKANADGFITMFRKYSNGATKQYSYKFEDLMDNLEEWTGIDSYFTQNTMWIPRRGNLYVRQLRALYVDIDFYTTKYTKQQVLKAVSRKIDNKEIPNPNLIIHSGRGIVLIFQIHDAPKQFLPTWATLERYFTEQFKKYGADAKCTDAARVFRMAGTINSKNGETVYIEKIHTVKSHLNDLVKEFLPDLDTNPFKKKSTQKIEKSQKEGKKNRGLATSKIQNFFNLYKLYYTRLEDLDKLLKLRNYEVVGHREFILFLHRYWSCFYLKNTDLALEATKRLNEQFAEPLFEDEVVKATQSAENVYLSIDDEKKQQDAKEGRTFKKTKYKYGYGYKYSNERLIEELKITEEEQRQLKTIISPKIKQERNTESKREKRREEGVKPREEYDQSRKQEKQAKIEQLKEIMINNPTLKNKTKIAKELGITRKYLYDLIEEL